MNIMREENSNGGNKNIGLIDNVKPAPKLSGEHQQPHLQANSGSESQGQRPSKKISQQPKPVNGQSAPASHFPYLAVIVAVTIAIVLIGIAILSNVKQSPTDILNLS